MRSPDLRWSKRDLLFFSAIWVATAGLYLALLPAPPLPFDDDVNIFANPYFLAGTWWKLWSESFYGMYVPITSSVWAALWSLGAGEGWPFRLLNAGLHLANTGFVYLLLRELLHRSPTQRRWPLYFATGLFALHPLQVAAVAWLSGGRDLLAAFFTLAALVLLLRKSSIWAAAFATVLFAAGLLAKPNLVTVPLAVWLTLWILREKIPQRIWITMSAWLALAAAVVLHTISIQDEVPLKIVSLWARPIVALDAFGFHLSKFVWPASLAVDYGRMPDYVLAGHWMLTVAVALVALASFALIRSLRLGLVWVTLMLPVSGVITFAYQSISTVADHYNYLSLGILAALPMLTMARASWSARLDRVLERMAWLAMGLLFAFSYGRSEVWKNEFTFFSDMAAHNPLSYVAAVGLASHYCHAAKTVPEGLDEIKIALNQRPGDLIATQGQALCLYTAGRYQEILAMEPSLKSEVLLKQFPLHDAATAGLLAAVGAAWAYSGDLPRGLTYLCHAEFRNPTQVDYPRAVAFVRKAMGSRGIASDCPPGQPTEDFLASLPAPRH